MELEKLIEKTISYLPFIALFAFIWSVTQFFLKRRFEKKDRKETEKIKVLKQFLTQINDIRVIATNLFNKFHWRTNKLKNTISEYRNNPLVKPFLDTYYPEENFKDYEKVIKQNFKKLSTEEREEFITTSIDFFEFKKAKDLDLFELTRDTTLQLEEKALELNKIPLLELFVSKKIIKKRDELIEKIENIILDDISKESNEFELDRALRNSNEILVLSYDIEYLLIAELEKL